MKYQLHAMAAATAFGLFWGIALFLWTLAASANGFGSGTLELVSEIYPFYEVSMTGALWGLLWGFVDAFIGIYIIVWLYNLLVKKLSK